MIVRRIASTLIACLVFAAPSRADTFYNDEGGVRFEMEFVAIGDPGNPGDPLGNPAGAGAVDYAYRIGKYEVSWGMTERIRGLLGITTEYFDIRQRVTENSPAEGLNWNEMARFVNWMNTSKGYTPAYKFAIQPGEPGYDPNADILLWEPGDPGYDPDNLYRNSLAHYFLPSHDEWYKAAYYDPIAEVYYDHPTGSNTAPTPVLSGTDPNTAVYRIGNTAIGAADVDQAGGLSPYGVMGMGGNVWELLETSGDFRNDNPIATEVGHLRRGGRYDSGDVHRASNPIPSYQSPSIGFRVASVPEPGGMMLAALAGAGLLVWRRLGRRRTSRRGSPT